MRGYNIRVGGTVIRVLVQLVNKNTRHERTQQAGNSRRHGSPAYNVVVTIGSRFVA